MELASAPLRAVKSLRIVEWCAPSWASNQLAGPLLRPGSATIENDVATDPYRLKAFTIGPTRRLGPFVVYTNVAQVPVEPRSRESTILVAFQRLA